jgi:phosphoglycerate dehydrogenase-like enzyme
MRVVFAGRIAREVVLAKLRAACGEGLIVVNTLDEAIALVPQADALIISDPKGGEGARLAEALQNPNNAVRWIQILSAGYDGLMSQDIPPEIQVTNQGGAIAPQVAEHAMALILAMARHVVDIAERSSRHAWEREFLPPIISLEGKTLAIVGFGHIGQALAKRARAFDMNVVCLSRSGRPGDHSAIHRPLSELHAVLAMADVVAVTIAAARETRHLLNAAAFEACKPGALFTNVSRGETVDQAALAQALQNGHLAAAFIDVTDPEPLPSDDPLWNAPNLIISPHTAGSGSTTAGPNIAAVCAENLQRILAGKPLINLVSRSRRI